MAYRVRWMRKVYIWQMLAANIWSSVFQSLTRMLCSNNHILGTYIVADHKWSQYPHHIWTHRSSLPVPTSCSVIDLEPFSGSLSKIICSRSRSRCQKVFFWTLK
jgi:hypothetical protein